MRTNKLLVLAVLELVIALAFAAATAVVLLYERDDVWLQAVLVLGGLAGLLNGAYLLKQRNAARRAPRRRPDPAAKRKR
ncbi:DUF2530 domain-containing protein [Paenibacillus flagellatus]|nr:DUF2530 domain-containing protein [Paenibacillus flagellatus]